MKILQLTDLHVNAEGECAFLRADSLGDLRRTVDYLCAVELRPDIAVVTGDVSTDGSRSAYELAARELARLDCPVWVVPGNHDEKAAMKAVFGPMCHTALDGAPGLCLDTEAARLLLLDSAEEEVSAGGLSAEQLAWLSEQLAVPEDRPVMLWMHHFPFRSGYRGMDHPFAGEAELLRLLQGRQTYVCSGHLHAGVIRQQGSVTMMTAPAVSMLMELRPDTVRFYTQQSGFALHVVEDGQVTTHFGCVPSAWNAPYRFVH